MRIIISAVVITILGFFAYYVVIRIPLVSRLAHCHEQVVSIYHQPNLVTRHSHLSDDQICVQNKSLILEGILCFTQENRQLNVSVKEKDLLYTLARYTAKSSKTLMETVLDHNQQCPSKRTRIFYDLESTEPFAANFE